MQSTILNYKKTHILKLEKGDLLLENITAYAIQQNITAGHFSGIGALEIVHMSYFDTVKKTYLPTTANHVEIISCLGNISLNKDTNKIIAHAHIAVSDKNGTTQSGHLNAESKVSVTAEICLLELDGILSRTLDTFSRLPLFNFTKDPASSNQS